MSGQARGLPLPQACDRERARSTATGGPRTEGGKGADQHQAQRLLRPAQRLHALPSHERVLLVD